MPWNPDRRPLPARVKKLVLERDGYVCQMCHGSRCGNLRLEVDHIIPASAGGTDSLSNLRAAGHDPCHREKSEAERRAGLARRDPRRKAEAHPGFVN